MNAGYGFEVQMEEDGGPTWTPVMRKNKNKAPKESAQGEQAERSPIACSLLRPSVCQSVLVFQSVGLALHSLLVDLSAHSALSSC